MANITQLSNIHDNDLVSYVNKVSQFPLLSEEEELRLAEEWFYHQDLSAAQSLVTSHLRLVVKIAMDFKGYGMAIMDLISEGSIGLMHAVKKFDPTKGFRLSTYAMWWIKASIQEYVLKSWSLVKVGTTSAKRKLFFSLRKLKKQIQGTEIDYLKSETANKIAKTFSIPVRDVEEMHQHISSHDTSLNSLQSTFDDNSSELQDFVTDNDETYEQRYSDAQDRDYKIKIILNAIRSSLTEREQDIIISRQFTSEKAMTFDVLSKKHGVSIERIRQIEKQALIKLRKVLEEKCSDYN